MSWKENENRLSNQSVTITKIETEIKAAMYDVTKGATNQAIRTLEGVRRKLKVLEEKTKLDLKSLDLETAKTKDQIDVHSLSLREIKT